MARVDTLANFLSDVADAIRDKKGTDAEIQASAFDTEISSIVIPKLEATKAATPSTSTQTITPSQGYDGMEEVTITAVDSTIDTNIIQANIRAGVTILGVQGNLEPDKPDQTKTCTPTTSQQVIEPDTGYELASVTVAGVTADIDSNITAGNIAQGITILGITGTYDGGVTAALAGSY